MITPAQDMLDNIRRKARLGENCDCDDVRFLLEEMNEYTTDIDIMHEMLHDKECEIEDIENEKNEATKTIEKLAKELNKQMAEKPDWFEDIVNEYGIKL